MDKQGGKDSRKKAVTWGSMAMIFGLAVASFIPGLNAIALPAAIAAIAGVSGAYVGIQGWADGKAVQNSGGKSDGADPKQEL